MKKDKREQIKALYTLEVLVNKDNLTDAEKKEIKRLRGIIDGGYFRRQVEKTFVLEEYLNILEKMPDSTDVERAAVMGISTNQLSRGKRKYQVNIKKQKSA